MYRSLVADVSAFLKIFGILFYLDNKKRLAQTQARDSSKVKWILIKLASTLSVAEIEYNTACYLTVVLPDLVDKTIYQQGGEEETDNYIVSPWDVVMKTLKSESTPIIAN